MSLFDDETFDASVFADAALTLTRTPAPPSAGYFDTGGIPQVTLIAAPPLPALELMEA